ncbi:hypothetical protein EXIGLDRAFT_15010 [Exidia glandulosa HHB12029]|uniref:Uncharacterized protein n=1 Tax=Exidia glandulosa HHB12029 TaxID=1314781 RepID=A0A165QUM3_EXIGL|nr:hypothetical protein EXIGLDRAFT_15010 [Exidia glandulosa HHB12029]
MHRVQSQSLLRASDWPKHKAVCKYIQSCRQTTRHDAMILPANGGPAHLRKLSFSVDAACFPSAVTLRAPDLRDIFGPELQETRYHCIEAKDQPNADNDGEYMMFYNMSTRLPPNKYLLYFLRLDELPEDRPFWHGDVVIVKTYDRYLHRPKDLQKSGAAFPPLPEVDFMDVRMDFLPGVQNWMGKFYDVGFQDAVKNTALVEKLKRRDDTPLRQRKPVPVDNDRRLEDEVE